MSAKNNYMEQIDRYVLDELTDAERIAFEKEMQDNEELRTEVALMQHITVAFQRKEEEKLLQKKTFIVRYKKPLISIISAAAAILLFAYIGMQPKYSSGQLFETYFDETEFEIIPARNDKTPDEMQNELLFSRAIAGIPYHLQEAIDSLLHLSAMPADFEYREEAEWALALAYLKNGQRDKSQIILHQIIDKNSDYSANARELSEKLKSRKWF